MQHGNRAQLDTERQSAIDAFDSVWINECLGDDVLTPRAARAMKCARRLDWSPARNVNLTIMPDGMTFVRYANDPIRA